MAWMIREDQLDPDQREFVNVESKKSGNIWVKGFAGSGKSVLLIHSLKDIIQKEPNAKVAVVVYTHSLIDMFKTGMQELNLPSSIPVMTYIKFMDDDVKYDYIFCDEVQDLPARVLYAMNNRARKVIVAGDSNQSIYDTDPRWQEPVVNPNQVGDIINARAFGLNIIHRLSRDIIKVVQRLIPNINVWGNRRDATTGSTMIRLCEASSEQEEVKYIYQEALKGANVGESTALLLPTANSITKFANLILESNNKPKWAERTDKWGNRLDYGDLNRHFRSNGIKLQFIGSGYGALKDAEQNKEAIIMTYHSSKGLDFVNVFVPFLNTHFWLHPNKAETLFMVAMTRSRKNLYLTYFGYPHDLVDRFKDECHKVIISDVLNPRTTNRSTNNFDF